MPLPAVPAGQSGVPRAAQAGGVVRERLVRLPRTLDGRVNWYRICAWCLVAAVYAILIGLVWAWATHKL